jgi:adenosylcobinamide amidohydrolase
LSRPGIAPRLVHHDDGEPVLVWDFDAPHLVVSSAPLGGGIGPRSWAINAQVPRDYERTDIDDHLRETAGAHGCTGDGVGMLTAARVSDWVAGTDGDVHAYATVGVTAPTWAADADDAVSGYRPGTINVVAFVPCALDASALVNAVMTVTEAKSQALFEHGVPGTGTASDAVCVVCTEDDGRRERFAGPRSRIGASLARAVHRAVGQGLARGDG